MRRDETLLGLHLVLALVACVRAASASTDTWAVLISSSRYWLNYRHSSNALGVYQAIRRQGIPDSHIILMLAEQPACSPRNIYPGRMHLDPVGGGALDLLGGDAEVDYRGRDVSVDSVLRVLTGHHLPGTPASKRLLSGPASRVLVFLSGHGGDEFLKFHDEEELLAADIADAVHQMAAAGRYGQMLLLADTCQASTLYARLEPGAAPGVLAIASSKLGQSSYAHHVDRGVGQHVVDQMSYHLQAFLHRLPPHPAASGRAGAARGLGGPAAAASPSLQQLVDHIAAQRLSSEVQVRQDLSPRSPARVPVADFFAAPAGRCPHAAGQRLATPASRRAAEALLVAAEARRLPGADQAWPSAQLPGAVQQRSGPWAPALHAAGRPLPSTAAEALVAWVAAAWAVLVGLVLRLSKA